MDLALGDVRSQGGIHTIQIKNKGGMAMPFDIVMTYADGASERIHQTPAIWKNNPREIMVNVPNTKTLSSVLIDGGIFVDFGPARQCMESRSINWRTPGRALDSKLNEFLKQGNHYVRKRSGKRIVDDENSCGFH